MKTIKYIDQWTSAPQGWMKPWMERFPVSPMLYWCTRAYVDQMGGFGPYRNGLRLFWN